MQLIESMILLLSIECHFRISDLLLMNPFHTIETDVKTLSHISDWNVAFIDKIVHLRKFSLPRFLALSLLGMHFLFFIRCRSRLFTFLNISCFNNSSCVIM